MSLTLEDLRITDALDRKADLRPEFIKGDPYCIAGRGAMIDEILDTDDLDTDDLDLNGLDLNGLDYFTFTHTPFVSCWQQYFYSYVVFPQ